MDFFRKRLFFYDHCGVHAFAAVLDHFDKFVFGDWDVLAVEVATCELVDIWVMEIETEGICGGEHDPVRGLVSIESVATYQDADGSTSIEPVVEISNADAVVVNGDLQLLCLMEEMVVNCFENRFFMGGADAIEKQWGFLAEEDMGFKMATLGG